MTIRRKSEQEWCLVGAYRMELGKWEGEGKWVLSGFVSERKRKQAYALKVLFWQQSERCDSWWEKKQVFKHLMLQTITSFEAQLNTKLSLVVAQGQKDRAVSKNLPH